MDDLKHLGVGELGDALEAELAIRARPWERDRGRFRSIDRATFEALAERVAERPDDTRLASAGRWLGWLAMERALFATHERLLGAATEKLPTVVGGERESRSFADTRMHWAYADTPVALANETEALASLAPRLQSLVSERMDREREVAASLGRESAFDLIGVDAGASRARATAWLEAFHALGDAVWDGAGSPGRFERMCQSRRTELGRATRAAWPAGAIGRTLAGWFGTWLASDVARHALDGERAVFDRKPRALAELFRGLERMGLAIASEIDRKSRPFLERSDPASIWPRAVGMLFSLALSEQAFLRRELELGAGSARDEARVVHRALAFALARRAVGAIGASALRSDRDVRDRMVAAWLGAPLPSELAGLLPISSFGSPVAFDGMLAGLSLRHAMVQRADEDWYRNPRAPIVLVELMVSGATPWADDVLAGDAVAWLEQASA